MFQTCGLAKNVLFTLGDVTVLLQAHIIETALYKILLGKLLKGAKEMITVTSK